MILQTYFPQKLSAARYDSFLASGWFRGSVMLYKLDLLCVEHDLFSVVNIRLDLENYSHKKRFRKLLRNNDELFITRIGPARIDADREALYQAQKFKFKGFIHNTLQDYLHAGFQQTVFDTREVAVYHNSELVAVSYFDLGGQSAASLLGLYNPDYSEYSLGIYTMLKEVDYAVSIGRRWYYPGYVLDKDSSFNYKLRLGEYEYYNSNKRWSRFEKFRTEETLAFRLKLQHDRLLDAMKQVGVAVKPLLYPYFSMGYMNFWGETFVRNPLIACPIHVGNSDVMVIAVYDLDDDQFQLLNVRKAPEYELLINMEMSAEFKDGKNYFPDLLVAENLITASTSPFVIASKAKLLC